MTIKPQSENNKKIRNQSIEDAVPQLSIDLQKLGLTTIGGLAKASPQNVSAVTGLDIFQAVELCRSAAHKIRNQAIEDNLLFTNASNLSTNKMERIFTGSKSLDSLFGGGIEVGAVTQFYGDPVTGKTQLCHTLCVMLLLPCEVIYIDTEHRFRPERIGQISISRGLDSQSILKRIKVAKPSDSNEQELYTDAASSIINKSESSVKLLIIDSMTDLYKADYCGRKNLAERQQRLNNQMHNLSRLAQKNKIAVVITNQTSDTPDSFYNNKSPIGGKTLLYSSSYIVLLKGSRYDRMYAELTRSPFQQPDKIRFSISENGIEDTSSD
jgi:DNA repair protein RadA